jgi:hypothetical protein
MQTITRVAGFAQARRTQCTSMLGVSIVAWSAPYSAGSSRKCCTSRNNRRRFFSDAIECEPSERTMTRLSRAFFSSLKSCCARSGGVVASQAPTITSVGARVPRGRDWACPCPRAARSLHHVVRRADGVMSLRGPRRDSRPSNQALGSISSPPLRRNAVRARGVGTETPTRLGIETTRDGKPRGSRKWSNATYPITHRKPEDVERVECRHICLDRPYTLTTKLKQPTPLRFPVGSQVDIESRNSPSSFIGRQCCSSEHLEVPRAKSRCLNGRAVDLRDICYRTHERYELL